MRSEKPKLLFITDLHYPINGREYFKEDLFLSSRLREHFDLVLCGPLSACRYLGDIDLALYRNTGPVIYHRREYLEYRNKAIELKTKVFNQLSGKADMLGKQYLVNLFELGFPVIPTVDDSLNLGRLPIVDRYVLKLKDGSDSIGVEFLECEEIKNIKFSNNLLQPAIDFKYEVSFYYINHDFVYALYAPDTKARWKLETYLPTKEDLEFSKKFIDWNDIEYGIQRVDAIRTKTGELLLMELEDLNPYLSLDCLSDSKREEVVQKLIGSLLKYSV